MPNPYLRLTSKNYFFLAAAGLCIFLTYMVVSSVLYYTSLSYEAHNDLLLSVTPQLARKKYDVNGSAYIFLALGAQANSLTCPAAIESLVRYAGWDGHVYLMTDRPSCFDTDKIIENAGMNPDKMHLHVVDGDFSSGGYDSRDKVGFRKARLKSLTMKTHIFDEIKDPNIHTFAYADCDIIFGVEGCASDFIEKGPQWDKVKIKFSRMYYSDATGKSSVSRTEEDSIKQGLTFTDMHSGTFVVHRQHSKELMEIWAREMESMENV